MRYELHTFFPHVIIFNGPFTAAIEYQNYYGRDATAETNGSAGFVGGVMKRSEIRNDTATKCLMVEMTDF